MRGARRPRTSSTPVQPLLCSVPPSSVSHSIAPQNPPTFDRVSLLSFVDHRSIDLSPFRCHPFPNVILFRLLPPSLNRHSWQDRTMPGSSSLFAILRCFNQRNVYADKPRSFMYDAQMVIGFENEKQFVPIFAVGPLNHFADDDDPAFVDSAFYMVSGRIASIDNNFVLGDEPDADRYDFLLDADMVRSSFPTASASSLTRPPSDAVASRNGGLSSPTATPVDIRCRAYTPSPPFPFPTVSPFPQAGAKRARYCPLPTVSDGAAAMLVCR